MSEVGVLDKAMAIVDVVEFQPMTASAIARRLGTSVSTTHRLASSMVTHGLLQRDGAGVYSLGLRFDSGRLALAARPLLTALRDKTAETTQFWVRRGDLRLCLESVETPHELRVTLATGTTLPLSDGGSAARVLLGETRRPGAEDLPWIESISQRTVGVCSVSAPVDVDGRIIGAICLAAPVPRVATTLGEEWGRTLAAAARALGERLAL
ncbi:Transcriptional regulator, IclR family [Gulosibacter sp. 10]|nr:Transcriptional regulator, IclR family [Gulosibacter sp. 10]